MAEYSGSGAASIVVAAPVSTPVTAAVPPSPQFWCHVCASSVATVIDVDSAEVCCRACGGNFVEEVDPDDPPQGFNAQEDEHPGEAETAAAAATLATTSADTQTVNVGGTFGAFETDAADGLDAAFRARRARFRRYYSGEARAGAAAGDDGDRPLPPPADLLQFLSGSMGRTGRTTFGGTPVEVFVNDGDGDGSGLLNALGGIFGLSSPMLAGNPGDYAFGSMANVINQLMQNDPNRHGAPPAAKEAVEMLPKLLITQADVDASAECPVCKDLFTVDEQVHKLPCSHLFHPDCILPWLKQHNSCPVCRFELPTDDPDYERRRPDRAANSS